MVSGQGTPGQGRHKNTENSLAILRQKFVVILTVPTYKNLQNLVLKLLKFQVFMLQKIFTNANLKTSSSYSQDVRGNELGRLQFGFSIYFLPKDALISVSIFNHGDKRQFQ